MPRDDPIQKSWSRSQCGRNRLPGSFGPLLNRQIRRTIGAESCKMILCVPVAPAIQGTLIMRKLVMNIAAGLAAFTDTFLFVSRSARYRAGHKPLAGPRPGSWLPG